MRISTVLTSILVAALAASASAVCPTFVAREESYSVGTIVSLDGNHYKQIRATSSGWIYPTDTYFWLATTENCDGSSSTSSGSSSTDLGTQLSQVLNKLNENYTDPRDGQVYKLVKVGTQTWMGRNLNFATKDGSSCYDNRADLCTSFGRLYDFATANNVCPSGWHLPSPQEWETLEIAVGGSNVAAKKLKATSTWTNLKDGVDEVGFGALPAGAWSEVLKGYGLHKYYASWWTNTPYNAENGSSRVMNNGYPFMIPGAYLKNTQLSVRCLQD
jgi:uncharacterized protein (TIGR02145 family)